MEIRIILVIICVILLLLYQIPRIKFYREYRIWKKETSLLSHSVYDNKHYKNIVKMGKKAVSFILEVIKKHPDPVVNALPEIFPGVIEVSGSVSLEEYCKVWVKVLEASKP